MTGVKAAVEAGGTHIRDLPHLPGVFLPLAFEFRVVVLFIMMRDPVGWENPSPSLCVRSSREEAHDSSDRVRGPAWPHGVS